MIVPMCMCISHHHHVFICIHIYICTLYVCVCPYVYTHNIIPVGYSIYILCITCPFGSSTQAFLKPDPNAAEQQFLTGQWLKESYFWVFDLFEAARCVNAEPIFIPQQENVHIIHEFKGSKKPSFYFTR